MELLVYRQLCVCSNLNRNDPWRRHWAERVCLVDIQSVRWPLIITYKELCCLFVHIAKGQTDENMTDGINYISLSTESQVLTEKAAEKCKQQHRGSDGALCNWQSKQLSNCSELCKPSYNDVISDIMKKVCTCETILSTEDSLFNIIHPKQRERVPH